MKRKLKKRMKKRFICLLTLMCMFCAMLPHMPVRAAMVIDIGEYMQMGTYYGQPILWRCVDVDENGPLMLSDKILCLKAFDAQGYDTSGSHSRGYAGGTYRTTYGSNYWADSNIRDWLNSDRSSVKWSCGNPPDKDHIWNGYNAYDSEAGFLTNFTLNEKNAMLTVTQKSLLDGYEHDSLNINQNYHRYDSDVSNVVQNYNTAYCETTTDKMFLLDVKQLNSVYDNLGDYYIGKPTQACVDNSQWQSMNLNSGNNWYYWLRSPDCDYLNSSHVRAVSSGGNVTYNYAYNSNGGIRPAFYLNTSSVGVRSGTGTKVDPYKIGEDKSSNSASTDISIGDYVKLGTYYGEPILWRCVDVDEYGPLMLSDRILCLKAWDAAGDNVKGSHVRGWNDGEERKKYGSNYWADSNIRGWLNSESSNTTWLCGNPPDKEHISEGCNSYDKEAGFLTNFTQDEKNIMRTVTQKTLLDGYEYDSSNVNRNYHRWDGSIKSVVQNYATAYSDKVTDRIFLLDVKQLNAVYNNLGDYYMAKPTQACVDNSEYKSSYIDSNSNWYYWLRSPNSDGDNSHTVRAVFSSGNVECERAYSSYLGIRPAFYIGLESEIFKSGTGTKSDPYSLTEAKKPEVQTSFGSTASSWSKNELEEAYTQNLVPDVLIGEDLTRPVNRAEFAAIAVRLYEKLSGTTAETGENPFTDITYNICENDILKAYNLGITNGTTDDTFEPGAPITREQVATMLTRAYKKSEWLSWNLNNDSQYTLDSNGVEKFSDDGEMSDWAKESVYFMAKQNIINGMGDGTFAPKAKSDLGDNYGYATREQALVIALRSANNL